MFQLQGQWRFLDCWIYRSQPFKNFLKYATIYSMKKGFTLVELMVVISIIALFSSIGMFSYADARQKANDAKKQVETDQVEKAIILYKDSKGYVPPNYTGTNPLSVATEGSDAYNQSMQELVAAGYLPSVPKSTDGSYVYYSESATQPQTAAFGARLRSSAPAPTAKTSCAGSVSVPATYTNCWLSAAVPAGTQNTVTISYPGNLTSFCPVYGNSLCFTGYDYDLGEQVRPPANDQFQSACPINMRILSHSGRVYRGGCADYDYWGGNYQQDTVCQTSATTTASTCTGSGNDYCACIQ